MGIVGLVILILVLYYLFGGGDCAHCKIRK